MTNSDLHRTNINLYASDVEWLRNQYGWGWTERVRDMLHEGITKAKARRGIQTEEGDMHSDLRRGGDLG